MVELKHEADPLVAKPRPLARLQVLERLAEEIDASRPITAARTPGSRSKERSEKTVTGAPSPA